MKVFRKKEREGRKARPVAANLRKVGSVSKKKATSEENKIIVAII